jgi:5-methylcytosine-specific restriction endonuclease McrA
MKHATDTEIWTGSKRQKDALRQKFGGRCAYCGFVLDKMHADHLVPVLRVQNDPWGRRLPAAEQIMHRPEQNTVANMMPACGPCNLHKAGYRLEEWRALLARSPEILARDKSIFRAAQRFGLITVNEMPVTFYFERLTRPC